jgi:hypothetical protein
MSIDDGSDGGWGEDERIEKQGSPLEKFINGIGMTISVWITASLVTAAVFGLYFPSDKEKSPVRYADTNRDGVISDAEKRAVYNKVEKLIKEYNRLE